MSHPDPALVDVRTLADHPPTESGRAAVRMVVTGSATDRRFGLVEYRLAPHSRGAEPHYHQTFSESFYVVEGSVTLYAGDRWRQCGPGDFAIAHERGVHGFRNDSDDPATFLILFTPGIAREQFFGELLELARSGRKPTPEEMTAFYARHDQVMVDI